MKLEERTFGTPGIQQVLILKFAFRPEKVPGFQRNGPLIGIRDSPDHRSVHNKEVNFICIYSLGSRLSARCLY